MEPFWVSHFRSVWVSHFVVHKTKPNKVVKKLFKHNDMLLANKVL